MKSLSKIISIALVLLAFSFTSNIYADPGNGQGGGTNNNNGQNNSNSGFTQYNGSSTNNNGNGGKSKGGSDSIPLDGGISFLLAAAAFFGIKKLRGNKKNVM